MPFSQTQRGLTGLALVALAIFGWSLYRDYCRDKAVPGAITALADSLDVAKRQAQHAKDALALAVASLDGVRAAYRADRRKDAAHDTVDVTVRDSLARVVAGAERTAHDSAATVDSLRRAFDVADQAWKQRAATDSGALVRLRGALAGAEGVIRADSGVIRQGVAALATMERRAVVAEALSHGWQAESARQARQKRLWMLGAGVVTVVAMMR